MQSTPWTEEITWPSDAVEVGRIVDAWGVKGWIKVQPYSDDPQALFSSKRWFLQSAAKPVPASAARQADTSTQQQLLKVIQAKEHGDFIVASVQDVSDRNQAEALKGSKIFVPRTSFPTADPNEFYWVDLMGMTVINREDQVLGIVQDLIDTGPHSVLCVRLPEPTSSDQPDRLIPFVSVYVDHVDQEARCIRVDWGLDY